MGLVRPAEILRVDPDTNGYLVVHNDGEKVHVPFRHDHADFHAVQDFLAGYRFGAAAERPAPPPPPAAEPEAADQVEILPIEPARPPLGAVTVIPPRRPEGKVVAFIRKVLVG